MPAHLDFYVAPRAGQAALVRRADGHVVGWLVRGSDDLLRVRPRLAGVEVAAGEATVSAAVAAFLDAQGWAEGP